MRRELRHPAISRHIPPHPASGDENFEKLCARRLCFKKLGKVALGKIRSIQHSALSSQPKKELEVPGTGFRLRRPPEHPTQKRRSAEHGFSPGKPPELKLHHRSTETPGPSGCFLFG
jgi:hypothetical protein